VAAPGSGRCSRPGYRAQITLAGRIGQWPEIAITALTIAALAVAIAARPKGMGVDRHAARIVVHVEGRPDRRQD